MDSSGESPELRLYNRLVPSGLRSRAGELALVLAAASILVGACSRAEPARKEVVLWKQLGSWSGRGNATTESFIGLTGSLRFRWRAINEEPRGQGHFKLILQSAISGRDLQEPVDQTGPGEGTAYAADDPRLFRMVVESTNIDWSVTVDEASFATATK